MKLRFLAALTLLLWGTAAPARAADPVPTALANVDVVEHLGARVPMDLAFTDSNGVAVRLGDYFGHGRPVILTLGYYECPMLCSLVLNGVVNALRGAEGSWQLGRDYDLVSVSINPSDKPLLAEDKRINYLQSLGAAPAPSRWPFLTGGAEPIRRLADAVGFRYNFLPSVNQYAHSAVVFVLTPDGRMARYLYGVSFPPRDLRLAMTEAAQGRPGPSVDRLLLSCFRYSPASRRYHFYVYGFLRAGGLLIFSMLALLLFILWRADLRRREPTCL